MNPRLAGIPGAVLRLTRLELFPVRVRSGLAAGARWTLFPWTSYWRGTHEPELHEALGLLGGGDIRGWTCWDLGAHFGIFSVGLARRVGETGQVAAFEPNPRSCARLRRHARMNGIPWLRVFEAAVSDRPGLAELYTYGDLGSTITHLAYEGETAQELCRPLPVSALVLDALVDAGEIRPPQFVKIDVEGHGHRALSGMRRVLESHRPVIAASFHSGAEVSGIVGPLAALGYRHRPVGHGGDNRAPQAGSDFIFTPPDWPG
jgi:FkbM family methyltransferase